MQSSAPAKTTSSSPLSLATKESRKDKETGKYNERTEWHNLIIFGKLAEFAGKHKKGAHIQIEGKI
jgi:single-strand DNA-binding protein